MRLATRVKRLEGRRGACPACGGTGRLAVVLDDDGVPAGAGCPRCRRVTIMRIEEITREAWDGQQARRARRTA